MKPDRELKNVGLDNPLRPRKRARELEQEETGHSVRSAIEQKPEVRAAQYLFRAAHSERASTEHQQSSTQNQADKIKAYADAHGMEIVRTYADEGKSGGATGGRASLTNLIADIQAGDVDFNVILVYDVSRWGRFQDMDESACYEHICRRAGIQVVYCAGQFGNDAPLISTILKSVKRAMAAEYRRHRPE